MSGGMAYDPYGHDIGTSNRNPFPRQSSVIVKYRNDTSFDQNPTGVWHHKNEGDAVKLFDPRQGDLVLASGAYNQYNFQLAPASGSEPTLEAFTTLNGKLIDGDYVCVGLSPYDYMDDRYSAQGNLFDIHVSGAIGMNNTSGGRVRIGDTLAWDFPDEDKVQKNLDWGYRHGPTGDPARLTAIVRRFDDACANWFSVFNLANPDNIKHNFLKKAVKRMDIPALIDATLQYGIRFDWGNPAQVKAQNDLHNAIGELRTLARDLIVATVIVPGDAGDDIYVNQNKTS